MLKINGHPQQAELLHGRLAVSLLMRDVNGYREEVREGDACLFMTQMGLYTSLQLGYDGVHIPLYVHTYTLTYRLLHRH